MARFNAIWKTHLYSLVVEDDGRRIALNFHGVRRQDVETVLQSNMGLGSGDYHIEHYTALERYFVLAPHEAFRLGAALGGVASNGRGRAARKQYVVRDFPVPLVVGKRARRTAQLTIYRVRGGATAQYKVELRLKGRSRDRTQFSEEEVPRLDALLAQLVSEHGLTPVAKPGRWEPVSPSAWRRDARLAAVGQSAYRGKAVDADRIRLARERHTPSLRFLTGTPNGSLTSVHPEYIRKSARSEAVPSSPCSRRPRIHRRLAWRSLAHDISRYEGYLSEVVLDANQDPAPLIEALIEKDGNRVGIGMITHSDEGHADVWGSVARLAIARPVVEDTDVLVLVIDFSVVLAIEAAEQRQRVAAAGTHEMQPPSLGGTGQLDAVGREGCAGPDHSIDLRDVEPAAILERAHSAEQVLMPAFAHDLTQFREEADERRKLVPSDSLGDDTAMPLESISDGVCPTQDA